MPTGSPGGCAARVVPAATSGALPRRELCTRPSSPALCRKSGVGCDIRCTRAAAALLPAKFPALCRKSGAGCDIRYTPAAAALLPAKFPRVCAEAGSEFRPVGNRVAVPRAGERWSLRSARSESDTTIREFTRSVRRSARRGANGETRLQRIHLVIGRSHFRAREPPRYESRHCASIRPNG